MQATETVEGASQRRRRGPAKAKGRIRLTERDKEIIRWIGRQRYVTAEHVQERFEMSRPRAYARLAGLVQWGYLRHERVFHEQPGVYWATSAGLAYVDSSIEALSRVDVRSLRHDLLVVSLAIRYEKQGHRVVTEREIRSATFGKTTSAYAVKMGQGPAGPRWHYPDLIIEADGQKVAVELELTPKRQHRLSKIIKEYAWATSPRGHLAAALYVVDKPSKTERLQKLIQAERVQDRIRVEVYAFESTDEEERPD